MIELEGIRKYISSDSNEDDLNQIIKQITEKTKEVRVEIYGWLGSLGILSKGYNKQFFN